jgi:acyl-CoA reductase-like NAD-dependent aldehyde dehydrogenase
VNLLTHNREKSSAKAKAFLARSKKLYINGQFVDAAEGETPETKDPAVGTFITRIPSAGKKDVERAALTARKALDKRWRAFAPPQRASYLFKLADLITENLEKLAQLEAYDSGEPVRMASVEIWFSQQERRKWSDL